MNCGYQSFSMRVASPGAALFVVLFSTVVILAAPGYLAWWALGGGYEREVRLELAELVSRDTTADARAAVECGDYRLYRVGDLMEPLIPGIGYQSSCYADTFGYRGVRLVYGHDVSGSDVRLNERAMQYMAAYNKVVFAYVNAADPGWADRGRERQYRVSSQQC